MKIKKLSYHRNGCTGLGFYAGIVEVRADGEKREMLVIRPPKEHDKETGLVNCFVFDLGELDKRNIQFGTNSFRGDWFHKFMDNAIESAEVGTK